MATIYTPAREADARRHYRPRASDVLQRLFRERFPVFTALYEDKYAASCGKYRLPLIQRAAQAFRVCGDWHEGIARVHCHDCGYDLFVPFSCKSFFLCQSCGQKRTLLLGEYAGKDLLLSLPHRQFVWMIPRCLRVFLKHNRTLHAELSRLIFMLLTEYFSEAAGRKIMTGMVSSLQTFGEYTAWNPHWHTIVLEGGFDRYDKFFFIHIGASDELVRLWRKRVIGFFADHELINADFARKLLDWKHSGFSIENGTRIYSHRTRESLCQYIVRAPAAKPGPVSWPRCMKRLKLRCESGKYGYIDKTGTEYREDKRGIFRFFSIRRARSYEVCFPIW